MNPLIKAHQVETVAKCLSSMKISAQLKFLRDDISFLHKDREEELTKLLNEHEKNVYSLILFASHEELTLLNALFYIEKLDKAFLEDIA